MTEQAKPASEFYVERPDLGEIFVDSIHNVSFQSTILKIELCSMRFDQGLTGGPPRFLKVPVCRLVMPTETIVELRDKLQGVIQKLTADGILKVVHPAGTGSH